MTSPTRGRRDDPLPRSSRGSRDARRDDGWRPAPPATPPPPRARPAGGSASGQVIVSAARVAQSGADGYGEAFGGGAVGSRSRARTSSPPRSGRASSPTSSPPRTRSCPTSCSRRASSSSPSPSPATSSCSRCHPAATCLLPGRPGPVTASPSRSAPRACPVGDYTRTVIGRLPERRSAAILENVRSNEPDVGGVVGKLTQGAVDAGFVYRSDVEGTDGRLRPSSCPSGCGPPWNTGWPSSGRPQPRRSPRRSSTGLLDGPGAAALRGQRLRPRPGRDQARWFPPLLFAALAVALMLPDRCRSSRSSSTRARRPARQPRRSGRRSTRSRSACGPARWPSRSSSWSAPRAPSCWPRAASRAQRAS
jgi:molybdate transport system substrate-binding protein